MKGNNAANRDLTITHRLLIRSYYNIILCYVMLCYVMLHVYITQFINRLSGLKSTLFFIE